MQKSITTQFKRKKSTVSSHLRKEEIAKDEIVKKIKQYGLSENPRLIELTSGLPEVISAKAFNDLLTASVDFQRAITGSLVIPEWREFTEDLVEIFEMVEEDNGGANASYIPQLDLVNSNQMGLSVTTVHGQTFHHGDYSVPFCIQSSSKPFTYCIASTLLTPDGVHQHVGREPSGKGFNERVLLNSLPHNPMINSGAMMCAKLVRTAGNNDADQWDYLIKTWTDLAGGQKIGFMNSVYLSEKDTADRNYCLAYMMREEGAFESDCDIPNNLNFYFMNCAIEVTAKVMSVVASTLANSGVNPLTQKIIFDPDTVRNCLSLMLSCGMYDYSGEFSFKLGVPGKSGVSGVVIVPIIGVAGFCYWSPRLDRFGNSYRSIRFFEKLGERFGFHFAEKLLKQTSKKNPVSENDVLNVDEDLVRILFAAAEGNLDMAAFSIGTGTDVNVADYDGRTALHLAASEGHMDMVRYLISCGANPNVKDRFGCTPGDDAKREKHPDIVKYLSSDVCKHDTEFQNVSRDFLFFDRKRDGIVTKAEFFQKLKNLGFEESDPRFVEIAKSFDHTNGQKTPNNFSVADTPLVSRITKGDIKIPQWNRFVKEIDDAYAEAIKNTSGAINKQVPFYDKNYTERNLKESFLVNVRTTDGQNYGIGDSTERFTLNGLSSLVNYCIALETLGSKVVHEAVGLEPSGESIDSLALSHTESGKSRPHNPFTTAGAMIVSSMFHPELSPEERLSKLRIWYGETGLSEPTLNKECYKSLQQKSQRTMAVAYLLAEKECLEEDTIETTSDFYFQTRSLEWSLDDVSMFGVTLANNGINPFTGKQVFSPETVKDAVSMMYCTGMNTFAGEFSFSVGMSGKSSISGLNLALVPDVMACATFSAKIDSHGNSARASTFLEHLTKVYNFHIFEGTTAYHKINPTLRIDQEKVDITTLLSYAASGAELEVISYIEQHGVDVNVCDYDLRSMAHVAAAEQQTGVIDWLKSKGANFLAKDRWGRTALDEAVAVVKKMKN